jgi:hypothetical protein
MEMVPGPRIFSDSPSKNAGNKRELFNAKVEVNPNI